MAACSSSLAEAKVTLFDTTGQELTSFKLNNSSNKYSNPVLNWSPDSKRLLIIMKGEKKIQVWDTQAKLVSELQAANEIMLVSWSPDGSKFVTATHLVNDKSVPQFQI